MSIQAIHRYYNQLDQYAQFGGTHHELSLRRAFANLLEAYCVSKHLLLVDEVHLKGTHKRPDGTVKDGNRLDWGYWESKDPQDVLDQAIADKLAVGYPTFNIIFENTREIVLIQHGEERLRGAMRDADRLHRILTAFVEYERPEIAQFREAVEQFTRDIPYILEELRRIITDQSATNPTFRQASATFWQLCQESINPEITACDIQEMLIQHILTAEIFDTVFGDSHFHRENNIARALEQVIATFFTGTIRRNTLARIENYYNAIKAEAARIHSHHDKQHFLKVMYEHFYRAYNPKGADKLGIVYTPNEIVTFMIESADALVERHFKTSLAAPKVEILDPATGTGTFITALLDHIPAPYLAYKYAHEIHANEVAILPYYIANLNIEYTYQQKMQAYVPFTNIVFVDTLDNLGFAFHGKQGTFKGFGGSVENLVRIQRQNTRTISVIIGNPPYNANQMNENDNNKNREYFENKTKKTGGVDGRIKETYIKQSTAQKTKVYDMYARFIRWASDRLQENGMIAFITNRSYIDKRTFDGVRKCLAQEFDYIYVIDTRSDVRENPNIAGTTHNVFGIQTGVAIMFLVKVANQQPKDARIHYMTLTDEMPKREKLEWFRETSFQDIAFEHITPDKDGNWLHMAENDFETLLPIATKETKAAKSQAQEHAIFKLYSLGVSTNRDEWVYDFDRRTLQEKIKFFAQVFNENMNRDEFDLQIKWSETLKHLLKARTLLKYEDELIIESIYRPFCKRYFYFHQLFNDRLTENHIEQFGVYGKLTNTMILFLKGERLDFAAFATERATNMALVSLDPMQTITLYRYDKNGTRKDNITDWGLQQFSKYYSNSTMTKEDIFYYTYAVLHNPAYRRKYALNLKRDFPRLPFYRNFYKWVTWGKQLMDWHINYETIDPYPLTIQEAKERHPSPKAKLRAIPDNGMIILDDNTTILNIPETAWNYKLGNRSALHWILDQYKEKKPDDNTIAEKFNTYKFSDYKNTVLDLLQRVCTVSVKTVDIMAVMEREEPHTSS